ncbi:MAG: hypothetical protein Q6373_018250 [Candidatus Sigynarchaeota archaeon]
MISKTRVLVSVHFSIGIALLVVFLGGLLIDVEEIAYYMGVVGLGVILFPLIALGSLYDEMRSEKFDVKPWYIVALGLSAVVMIVDVILGVFIVIAITCAFLACTWSIVLLLDSRIRDRLGRFSIALARGVFVFLAIFMYFNHIDIPARAIAAGILEPWEAMFDILEGISMIGIMVFLFVVSRYRFGGLVSPLIVVYVYFFPAQQLVDHYTEIPVEQLPAFAMMASILVVLAVSAGLGLGRCISETTVLVKSGRSGLLGPWFAALVKDRRYPRASDIKERPFTPGQKHVVLKGIAVCLAMTLVILPGFLPYGNVFKIPIQIVPRTDYNMRFSFWAAPYISYYPEEVRAELSMYHANLDLTINQVTPGYVKNLTDFETFMSGITYRVVISPPSIDQLATYVETATNILLPYATNGTLPGWRGFCFDIEGSSFSDEGCNGSIDDEIAIWNKVFDWVGNRTINGKPIEMESVNYAMEIVDQAFDGDIDLQAFARHVSAVPDRFTTYAPMIYRCVFTGEKPYGSPMDLRRIWGTSYSVYAYLKTISSQVPVDRLGIYLGITNASCYGRDLPQPEPVSWGNATGLGNLQRDVLIAKSFGIKEVTFFLLQTYYVPGDYSNGGVFDTYGINFLQIMNDTANTNPPERFVIYYNKHDANLNQALMLDWILDFSRGSGLLQVAAMASAASLAVIIPVMARRLKKKIAMKQG